LTANRGLVVGIDVAVVEVAVVVGVAAASMQRPLGPYLVACFDASACLILQTESGTRRHHHHNRLADHNHMHLEARTCVVDSTVLSYLRRKMW
jgi:hypothetical protein